MGEISESTVEDNLISSNKEAGIVYDSSKGKVFKNRIVNNGLHGISVNNSNPEIISNVIVKNGGSGVLAFNNATPIVKNNIIVKNQSGISAGNVQGQISDGKPVVSFNNVWNNTWNYVVLSKPATDISADPLFVDEVNGDYHLLPSSPAIGAGEGGVDMGAYPILRISPILKVSANPTIANSKTGVITITVTSNKPMRLIGTDALTVTVTQAGAIPVTISMFSGTVTNTYIGSYKIITGRDGKATISATGADIFGNKAITLATAEFVVDTTPPDLTITTPDNQVVASANFVVLYSSKASDLSRYLVSIDSETDFTDLGTSEGATITLTNGEHIIRVKAIDIAGNESEVKQIRVKLSVKPVIILVDTPLTAKAGSPKLIKVKVESPVKIESVKLFYRFVGDTPDSFSLMTMFDDGLHNDGAANDGVWAGELPADIVKSGLMFFIAATDINNQTNSIINLPDGTRISSFTPAKIEVIGAPITLAPTVIIDPASQVSEVGKTVKVNVKIRDAIGLFGYQFDIIYDPTALKLKIITEGDFLKSNGSPTFFNLRRDESGVIKGAVASRLIKPGVDGTGVLAILEFEVVSAKDSKIDLVNVKLGDPDANPIPNVKLVGGTVSVLKAPPTLSIITPTPNQVFPAGTTSTTLTVKMENHTGYWHAHNKPFPTSGSAGGNIIVTSGNTTTITGLTNGQTYTVYVTLVDANHNVLNPPITASVTFSVAALPLTFTPTPTPIQLMAGSTTIPSGISVGSANGGLPPYVFTEGIPDSVWLNVNSDGTISLATGQVVPAAGIYQLFIQVKDSSSKAASGSVNITVIEKSEFSINALTPSQSTEVGKSTVYLINLVSKGGFKTDLTLRISDPPKGIEAEFNPKVVSISPESPSNSSQLTIRVGNDTPVGDHKFIVSAVALDKSVKEIELQLQVKPPSLKDSFITVDVEPTQPRLGDKLKVKGEVIFFGGEVKIKLPITINYMPSDGGVITQSLQADESGKYIEELEIKKKGKWEITASWAGDKTYNPAKRSVSIVVLEGLSQITLESIEIQMKVGSVVKIVGTLKTLIKGEPLKGEAVQIDIIKPSGTKKIQKVTTNEFGKFDFDVQFDSEGSWQIEASWKGNENYLSSKSEALSIPVTKENAKAIIVLGGGSESQNPAWNQFAGLANYVYKILKRRDLTDDDIYYLSPTEKTLAAVDSRTSKEALKFVITDWAKKRTGKNVPLFIYLLSHNLNDKFLLEKSKEGEAVLTPEDLASWLDVLDKDVEVTLIIEACFSGNFIAKKLPTGELVLTRSNRVIIASAKEDKQALILRDLSSFSKAFFDQIVRNESINTAFLKGRDSIRALRSLQSPQIDANGDGRPNDPTRDFPAVEKKYIPEFRLYLASVPEIKEVMAKPAGLKSGEKSATIEVKVAGTDITNVFANVVPPNFDPNKTFTDWNELNFDQIKFQKLSEGVYKGEYNNFILPGEYSIVVHAENPDGSAVPAETIVKVLSLSWDVNVDGEVNIFDLVIVASNIGQEAKNGDVNGDGKVDIFDLVIVAGHFGEKSIVAAPSIEISQIDFSQHLPILEKAYRLLESSSNPSPDFEKARKLLEQLISLAKPVVKETKLLPNYPNPFNPETWIPYQLAEATDVKIQIYDVTGRLIRTLRLGRQSPGLYINKERAAYWDGKNNQGELVASGVYYYRMQAGRFVSPMRKMVVTK